MFSVLFFRMLALPGLSFAVYPFFSPHYQVRVIYCQNSFRCNPSGFSSLLCLLAYVKYRVGTFLSPYFFSWLIVNQNCILMAIKMSWLGFCFLVVVRQLAVATNHE